MYLGNRRFDGKWVGKVNGLGGAGRSIGNATKSASTDQHPSKASLTSRDQKDINRTRNNLVTWFAAGDFGQSKVSELFVILHLPSLLQPHGFICTYICIPSHPSQEKRKKVFNLFPPNPAIRHFLKFLKIAPFCRLPSHALLSLNPETHHPSLLPSPYQFRLRYPDTLPNSPQ